MIKSYKNHEKKLEIELPTSHESGIIPELKIKLNKLTCMGKN
jgi:hypothetical protein